MEYCGKLNATQRVIDVIKEQERGRQLVTDQETHTAIFTIRSGPHGGAWIEGCRPGDHITITPIERHDEHEIECSFTAPEHVQIIRGRNKEDQFPPKDWPLETITTSASEPIELSTTSEDVSVWLATCTLRPPFEGKDMGWTAELEVYHDCRKHVD